MVQREIVRPMSLARCTRGLRTAKGDQAALIRETLKVRNESMCLQKPLGHSSGVRRQGAVRYKCAVFVD